MPATSDEQIAFAQEALATTSDEELKAVLSVCHLPSGGRDHVIGFAVAGDQGGVDAGIEGGEAGAAFRGEGEEIKIGASFGGREGGENTGIEKRQVVGAKLVTRIPDKSSEHMAYDVKQSVFREAVHWQG